MEIYTNKEDKRLTIAVAGRLDLNSAPELNQCIKDNMPGMDELILDLEETTYISSAGLRVILNARKTMKNKEDMKVIHLNNDLKEIFDMTGLSGLFEID